MLPRFYYGVTNTLTLTHTVCSKYRFRLHVCKLGQSVSGGALTFDSLSKGDVDQCYLISFERSDLPHSSLRFAFWTLHHETHHCHQTRHILKAPLAEQHPPPNPASSILNPGI